jgi:hypothetical protein
MESHKTGHEAIARQAHQLWEERGKPHGSSEEDWHRAEHELTQRPDAHADPLASSKNTK